MDENLARTFDRIDATLAEIDTDLSDVIRNLREAENHLRGAEQTLGALPSKGFYAIAFIAFAVAAGALVIFLA